MLRLAVEGTIAVPDDVLAVLIRWHAEPTRDAGRQRDLISRVANSASLISFGAESMSHHL